MTGSTPDRDDAGFTLIEVIVALFIFAVLSLSALNVIVGTMHSSQANANRTIAANLVTRQIESVRTQHASAIPNGLQTYTRTVGSTVFTIRQTASYVTNNNAASVCTAGSGALASKLVTVTATWPGMGTVKAPRADTMIAVDIGTDNLNQSGLGTLALAVTDAGGSPLPDVAVTLTPGNLSQTTGDDGCLVYPSLTVGTYSATVNTAGYVGTGSAQASTLNSLGVIAGTVTKGTLYYDTAASITITDDAPVTATLPTLPTLVPVHIGASLMVDRTLSVCPGTPTSACISAQPLGMARELYPDMYTIWAGQCLDPSASSQISADVRTASSATAVIPVGAVTVTVRYHGTAEPATQVTVMRQSLSSSTPASCAGTESYTVALPTGTTEVALPYGKWLVTGPGGASQTVSLTSTNTTDTATVNDNTH
jgi:prepilin-type N-terminal cleavage/methylation domain-containing protein